MLQGKHNLKEKKQIAAITERAIEVCPGKDVLTFILEYI